MGLCLQRLALIVGVPSQIELLPLEMHVRTFDEASGVSDSILDTDLLDCERCRFGNIS
jgi:hypothetical protein